MTNGVAVLRFGVRTNLVLLIEVNNFKLQNDL